MISDTATAASTGRLTEDEIAATWPQEISSLFPETRATEYGRWPDA